MSDDAAVDEATARIRGLSERIIQLATLDHLADDATAALRIADVALVNARAGAADAARAAGDQRHTTGERFLVVRVLRPGFQGCHHNARFRSGRTRSSSLRAG
jgi:hypothetical protein